MTVALKFYEHRTYGHRWKYLNENSESIFNISASSVSNHLSKFNKIAIVKDYFNFGFMIEEIKTTLQKKGYFQESNLQMIIDNEAKKYRLPQGMAKAFYYKYLIDKDNYNKIKNIERDSSRYVFYNSTEYDYLISDEDEVPF